MKSGVVFALAAAFAVTLAAACGSGGDGSTFTDGTGDGGDGSIVNNSSDGDPGGGFLDAGIAACVPRTCTQLAVDCGPQGDGCGGVVDCGKCAGNEVCGAGGPSKCGKANPGCVPQTTCPAGTCGPIADGCGALVAACNNSCTAPQKCGGGSMPSVCGGGGPTSDGGNCTPTKTTCAPGECGPFANGCGQLITCATCSAPDSCGGGGTASMCGRPACTPRTCASAGANCGPIGDGCGQLLQCRPGESVSSHPSIRLFGGLGDGCPAEFR